METKETFAWSGGKCRVPMWWGWGGPAGHCGEQAFGPQYPRAYLATKNPIYEFEHPTFCSGPCCPKHGGPKEGEPIIFQDGYGNDGRPMWCAVMPGFQNLQESEAGFDANPVAAVRNLHAALAKARGE